MKILLSFNDNHDEFYDKFINLLIANIILINKQKFKPTIYLDQKTLRILQQHKLNFNFVLTDDYTKDINTQIFWAYNKLILLSQQTEPYLFIDYDLYIKNINLFLDKLPKDKITFSHQQNKENVSKVIQWEYAFDSIINKVKELLPENKFFSKIEANSQYNASLICAPTNFHVEKIKEVSNNLIDLIKQLNTDDIEFNDRGNMCVFEQFPFYCYLKDYADVLYNSNPDYPPSKNQDIFHLTYLKYNDEFIETFIKQEDFFN